MVRKIVVVLLFVNSIQSCLFAATEIQHWSVDGARIYFVAADELPILDIRVLFAAGSSRDGDQPGLAALTAELLDQGAGGYDADQIGQQFASLGALYTTDIDRDIAAFSLRTLTTYADIAFDNFKTVLTQPDFPQEAIERERRLALIAIRQKQESPQAIARDLFYTNLYQGHPYALPVEGTSISVAEITRKQIEDFYKTYYVRNNAVIAIVGAISREKAEALCADLVKLLPRGKTALPLPPVSNLAKAKTVSVNYPASQTHILLGQKGIRRGDADYFPLFVGNHILGGGGMVSRLFENVREKRGLSYNVYSYFSPLSAAGPFVVGLQTKNTQRKLAHEVLQQTLLDFIATGPSAEELAAAKKNITGSFPLRLDSNSKILNYLSMIGFYNLPLDYLATFNDKVEAVTTDEIKAAFARHMTPNKWLTVEVGKITTAK